MKRDPHLWKDTYTYEKRPTMRTPMYGNRLIFTKRVARDWFTAWPIDWLRHWLYPWKETHMYEKRPAHTKRDLRIRKETNNADPRVWTQTYAYENREREGIDLLLNLLIGCFIDCIHEKRPTYTKRDLQCGPAYMETDWRLRKEPKWFTASLITFMKSDTHTWKKTYGSPVHLIYFLFGKGKKI